MTHALHILRAEQKTQSQRAADARTNAERLEAEAAEYREQEAAAQIKVDAVTTAIATIDAAAMAQLAARAAEEQTASATVTTEPVTNAAEADGQPVEGSAAIAANANGADHAAQVAA